MRGMVEGLESAAPVLLQLPGAFHEHDFTARFVSAFDVGLAPLIATLDSLAAYVDPELAPDDFVEFLAHWVGVELDEATDPTDRRRAVRSSVLTHRRRGTAEGLRQVVAYATGGDVEVTETGSASWSSTPGTTLPGEPVPIVQIRVAVDVPEHLDRVRLEAVVDSAKPAYVAHVIEVVAR